jgi:hypothetical protein
VLVTVVVVVGPHVRVLRGRQRQRRKRIAFQEAEDRRRRLAVTARRHADPVFEPNGFFCSEITVHAASASRDRRP